MSQILEHENERLRQERDLYLRLLELSTRQDLGPLLEEALSLIVEFTAAKKGFLAVYGEDSEIPRFTLAKGCSPQEVEGIRRTISRGIVAQAMATGQLISTPDALEDPRFQENSSVQQNQIEAVLCAPIGTEVPLGVLYLQDRVEPGAFSEESIKMAELFCRQLLPLVDRLLIKQRAKEQEDETQPIRKKLSLSGIIGKSRALAEVLRQVENAARYEISVLLTGPSGTGKTALARAIHENSKRRDKPFIELNCAAVPENLFEGELFGALPGSHSTATRKIPGKLAAAQGGTLFLDEIGELPSNAQSKLLQFLQSKEYFPLGATKAEKADVRILAATNADLEEAISKKSFREDLFYRLHVMSLWVPPLTERREDLSLLAEHFCEEACKKYEIPKLSLSLAAKKLIEITEWPGNIRQLSNTIHSASIRASGEESALLEPKHLFPSAPQGQEVPKAQTFQESTKRFQKKLLQDTMAAVEWNTSEAARRLGLTRVHVHNLIRAFELHNTEIKKR